MLIPIWWLPKPAGHARRQCSVRCSGVFHACAGLLADAGAVGVRVDARESARTHARIVETDYDPSNFFIIQLDSYIYF